MSRPLDRSLLTRFPLPGIAAADKNARGRVFVAAGSARAPGTALLCGKAAMRAGAGKVQLGLPRTLAAQAGFAFPECGIVALDQNEAGEPLPVPAQDFCRAVTSAQACLVGPGLLDDAAGLALAYAALRQEGETHFILDAMALPRLGEIAGRVRDKGARIVLTPNYAELAQLLDAPPDAVMADAARHAGEAAALFQCLVVAKADITHIATPEGEVFIHQEGAPGLAASGSGDVMAGVLAGLLARGAGPLTAALWAVTVHAEAGRQLGRDIAEVGYLASELLPLIPKLLQAEAVGE